METVEAKDVPLCKTKFICRHGTFPNPCKDCRGTFYNSAVQSGVVPSGGAPLPKSFHAAWGGPNGHGQVVKLEDALEYAASSNATLQQDVQRWRELWAATEDNRAADSALVSTLKGNCGRRGFW